MLRTMVSAANTLNQLQEKLDIVSNNISNSNTTGYKTKDAKFNELLYQEFRNDKEDRTVRQSPVGIRIGVGASIAQSKMNTNVGALQNTGRDLDFALTNKNQYFTVITDKLDDVGNAGILTRQGNFYMSERTDGKLELVNADGYRVADSNAQAITFDKEVESIGSTKDGVLNVTYTDGTTDTRELNIVQVNKPQVLTNDEGAYFTLPDNFEELGYNVEEILTDLTGAARTNVGVESGMLEGSNVDLSKEMTDLISTQRSYQFNARTITMADQMMGLINSVR